MQPAYIHMAPPRLQCVCHHMHFASCRDVQNIQHPRRCRLWSGRHHARNGRAAALTACAGVSAGADAAIGALSCGIKRPGGRQGRGRGAQCRRGQERCSSGARPPIRAGSPMPGMLAAWEALPALLIADTHFAQLYALCWMLQCRPQASVCCPALLGGAGVACQGQRARPA